ncbi:unnamed protein product [Schistocephalus solidus]|uniref:Reverse transcriptase domain-containing protein n=1 Tax=Schistocephalus solidus TaxID=70667 RepID=A0A183TSZ1_SCHSO|nr:unnamed protein product [Schistocephalus solidus]
MPLLQTLVFIHRPKIVIVTETWATPYVSDTKLSILGYAYIRNDRHEGRGGGSCIYVQQALTFLPLDYRQFTAVEESCWLRVVLKDNYSLLGGSVYRPPNASEDYDLCLSQAFHAAADLNLKYCLIADHFLQSRDSGFAIYTVYFDFTKAFDRVNHDLLLLKIAFLGIGNKLLNLITSYLNDHAQRVNISDDISNPTYVRSGVIQGSVLGPLLFCLFVNDVPDCFQYGRPFMYADDLKVAYRDKLLNRNIVLEILKKDRQAFAQWFRTWFLSLSWHKYLELRIYIW